MDEDDSQDELINRSSKSKGKRAALWAISDDSDEAGSVEDGESGSGEDEDDEDEDEDEEEEEGACAGTSADIVEVSSDEEADKCPICLHSFTRQPVATPENCEHYFCLDCILEWSKNANSCPIDRNNFKVIYLRTCFGGKVQKVITAQKPAKACQQETVDMDLEETSCEVCGASDREDRLLLCDGCDAGYHMECLTPPLDAVPVEEWFCPECEANNRQSRGSATEISDTESLPSTTRSASSRPRTHAGHIRAIARTQHSERVRANVNRHRITQARTQELAPTYLIRSTWLDETINAVVAGLNSSVYVRDLTPRSTTSRRRRTGRSRKSRKSSSKTKTTGVKRRKRKKRRKKMVMKKTTTIRSRIANNLGIVKDKKSSSLPTVYRPSESTLSSMRADIGAASLSIYGDPFDLDPFTDQEEEEEQAYDSSLLEAKRRGISRSAFRSHQPVARPVSLSRRPVNIPQAGGVVEAAPVPDLLGSILSGQSMLLMDSSDVVINRDGSLLNTKPATLTNVLTSGISRSSASGDGSSHTSAGILSNHVDTLGSSESPLNRHFSQSSSGFSPPISSSANHSETTCHVPRRVNSCLLGSPSHEPNRPNQRLPHQITNIRERREIVSPSSHLSPDPTSESKTSAQSHSIKAPTKPMWVDVSVLPRIPKKRRESSADDDYCRNDHSNNNRNGASSSSTSATSNGYGMPETGINRLAGDKERRHSLDQQHGRSDSQRNRPDGAGTSSGFSSSFSSSSSASHTNHQRHSSSSSSSSSVSFRISSSGNSWHSRRLNITSLGPSGANLPEQSKDEEERKRQLHRDKQKLLASRPMTSNNIYDPFNPTESDSDSSDGEGEGTQAECSSWIKEELPKLKDKALPQSKHRSPQVEVETQSTCSQDKPEAAVSQTLKQRPKFTKENLKENKKESRFTDSLVEKQSSTSKTTIKKEPESDADEAIKHDSHSETEDNTRPVDQKQDFIKMREIKEETVKDQEPAPEPPAAPRDSNTSAASSSSPVRSKHKSETKSETHTKSPSKDLEKETSKKPSKDQRARSNSPERDRRQSHSESKHGGSQKEKDKAKSSRCSRSKERRTHRVSDSSQSKSPDRTSKKRRRSRSRSKDRRRSRSRSSSRELLRVKKHKKQTRERNEDKDDKRLSSKDKKRDRSHSKSRSKSRSRSRSRERRRRRSHSKSRSRSRSRSREKRKDDSRHQSSRDKVESRFKEKKRNRSRSSSREKKKERPATKSQKTTNSESSSVKDKPTTKAKKKDDETPNKAEKIPTTIKTEPPSSFKSTPQVKKEPKESKIVDKTIIRPAVDKTVKTKKEIKKEKFPTFDIFEDSPNNKIKKEEMDTPVTVVEAKCKEETIETEICEKSEVKSPDVLDSTLSEQSISISTPPQDSPEQSTKVVTVPVKQEVHPSSDSDDDFNVDAILDNLDHLKSRTEKGTEDTFKQEKEEKIEGETAAVGAKSKTQVKRVTWNIQEPEGPQPDKAASKVALYKLKLKQEGIRRPSSIASTSSQDTTGTADVTLIKAGCDPHNSSGLGSDSTQLLSVSEGDEGDLLKKDKQYLKKLHMQERAIEEVKLAIKPFYQKRDINKDEYKEILRKAVQKVCHSKSGEINPVKVGNLVKAYVDKYKHARKYKKEEESGKTQGSLSESMKASDSP